VSQHRRFIGGLFVAYKLIPRIPRPSLSTLRDSEIVAFLRSSSFLRVAGTTGLAIGAYLLYDAWVAKDAEADTTDTLKIAKLLGGDYDTATNVVKLIGRDQAIKVANGELGLWCLRDRTGWGINRFGFYLKNNTGEPIYGQPVVVVVDADTGQIEFQFESYGYRLNPEGVLSIEMPMKADLQKAGMKKIHVVNTPPGVAFSAIDVLVVPFEVKTKTA